MVRRGKSVNVHRRTAMLLCAVGVIPIVFAYRVESTWSAVFLIGLAAACHQGFSANLYTLTSDMFPARAVGSVVGIGGMAGALGGVFIATIGGLGLLGGGGFKGSVLIGWLGYCVG